VFADVARFGQRRGVGDGERHVENAGERLREERFSNTRRTDEQDIRLVELDLVVPQRSGIDSLVVIVHRDRQRLLRLLLTDDVLVEGVLDLLWSRDLGDRFGYLALLILGEDLIAERDALVADVNRWAGDELPNRVLGLSAERTTKVFVVRHDRSLSGEGRDFGAAGIQPAKRGGRGGNTGDRSVHD